jgi:hypothetical protein
VHDPIAHAAGLRFILLLKIDTNRSKPGVTPDGPVETGSQTGAIRPSPGALSVQHPVQTGWSGQESGLTGIWTGLTQFSSNFDSTFCPKF